MFSHQVDNLRNFQMFLSWRPNMKEIAKFKTIPVIGNFCTFTLQIKLFYSVCIASFLAVYTSYHKLRQEFKSHNCLCCTNILSHDLQHFYGFRGQTRDSICGGLLQIKMCHNTIWKAIFTFAMTIYSSSNFQ